MRPVILAAVAFAAAACQGPPGPPIDPRVYVRPDAGVGVARPPLVSQTADGFTRVSLELRNLTSQDLFVACSTDWFDGSGQPEAGIMAVPTRVAVPVAGSGLCTTISPSARVHLFRIAVAPSF